MRTLAFLLAFLLASTSLAVGEHSSLYVKDNNIYYHSMQLTDSGINSSPVLSPNGKWVVFIKQSDLILTKDAKCGSPNAVVGDHASEIWIVNLNNMQKRLLVAPHLNCNGPQSLIFDPHNFVFSPDSKTLYFITSAWVTSGAIHGVNVDGRNLRFVTDGNELQIINKGRYKGDLIVNQHRYFDYHGGGSYDWDWLYTPTGKQIRVYKKQD